THRNGGPCPSLCESAAALPAAPPGSEKLPGRRTICVIPSRAASTAGIAQIPSAQRQDPPTTAITGTVSPEASAAPRNSAVEYRPIISPARWEKSLLIAVGSSTLP